VPRFEAGKRQIKFLKLYQNVLTSSDAHGGQVVPCAELPAEQLQPASAYFRIKSLPGPGLYSDKAVRLTHRRNPLITRARSSDRVDKVDDSP